MKRLMNFKWSILTIVIYLIVTAYFMYVLPADAKIPGHWNIHNEIDGWMNKTGMLIFGSLMSIGIFLLMYLLPFYSPKYKNSEARFEKIVPSLTFILVLFFSLINIYAMYLAYEGITETSFNFIFVLMGLLFIFLGNLLPKVPKNFFIGVKTPWTLSSDEIWQKTHRLSGWLFVLGGLLMLLKAFVTGTGQLFNTISSFVIFGMLLYPILHSFILFKKMQQ